MTIPASEAGTSWKVRILRVTAFFRLGWDVPAPTSRSFWKAACTDDPEVSERGLGHSLDVGRWNNGKLTVKIEPAGGDMFRLDMIWESAWYREDGVSTLKAFAVLVSNLVKSQQFPMTARLAVGANVGWPMADRTQAYGKLAAMLPRVRFDESMREVIFRYNRQGPSRDSGNAMPADLRLNRMTTWTCQQVTQLMPMLALNPTPASGPGMPFEIVAVCDLDLSTDAEHSGAWNAEQSLAWIERLIYEGLQIIEKGDPI